MGGMGSGRWGAGPTVDVSTKVSVYRALQGGSDRSGIGHACFWTFSNSYTGEVTRRLLTVADTEGVSPHVTFCHLGSEDLTDVVDRYRVDLDSTAQPLGGHRWWFRCPRIGVRVAALYLPNGARRFGSAEAYRLAYASQRATDRDRAIFRAHKLRRRLGAEVNPMIPVEKPLRMRWSTFDREMERLDAAEGRANAHMAVAIEALRRRAGI